MNYFKKVLIHCNKKYKNKIKCQKFKLFFFLWHKKFLKVFFKTNALRLSIFFLFLKLINKYINPSAICYVAISCGPGVQDSG